MFKKEKILEVPNIYTVHAFRNRAGSYIGAGSETDPVVALYDLDRGRTEMIPDCPGGMMSFLPLPGSGDRFVSIMGLFPPFIGMEAGIYSHLRDDSGWKTRKAMDLPFAHRCEFLQYEGTTTLVAATVSKFKEEPSDWSRPGELHLVTGVEDPAGTWKSVVPGWGITRNHGMTKTMVDGAEMLFISGAEGIFRLNKEAGKPWNLVLLFEREVSEMAFADLDGDGQSELITIEPFHGDQLRIYKQKGENWDLKFQASLSFGHGLSCGRFNGNMVVVAGNRSGSLNLEMFTIDNLGKGTVIKTTIETETGPTQTQVFTHGSVDYILSANQKKNEVALYSGDPGIR